MRRLRAQFAAPDEKLVLLVGRLVYEKGFQIALEAMPQVIEDVGNVRFLVAGSGTHEQRAAGTGDEARARRARHLPRLDRRRRASQLYRIADLTVVPSIYEPFGLVALEAMACGCPCLVADTGGLREVVPHEEVGLRFRSRDPASLAEVATRVLADEELGRRLVAEAHEHVREFDWADVADRTLDVYETLAATARIRVMMKTPVLYHLEISHYNEKARWALDYKNVPHERTCADADAAHAAGAGDDGQADSPRF